MGVLYHKKSARQQLFSFAALFLFHAVGYNEGMATETKTVVEGIRLSPSTWILLRKLWGEMGGRPWFERMLAREAKKLEKREAGKTAKEEMQ